MALAAPSLLAACGGTRQDAKEPHGHFPVSIVRASFPATQALAEHSLMRITVRNAGDRTIPDLAVTVNSFNRVDPQPGLADPSRPVFIVDQGPVGAETAFSNTWALGAVPAHQSRTFLWRVTAIQPGRWVIHYRVAAGLYRKAIAVLSGGGVPQGTFRVSVSSPAPQSRVDPNTGRVIRTPPPQAGPGRRGAPGGGPAQGYGTQGPSNQQPGGGNPGPGSTPGG